MHKTHTGLCADDLANLAEFATYDRFYSMPNNKPPFYDLLSQSHFPLLILWLPLKPAGQDAWDKLHFALGARGDVNLLLATVV
ncbi:hypothetical protein HYQ44_002543 [Verticillium longisporum]|nr:hypothetical protein HYQ44_002543 [Verticillium longisporum]